MTSKNPAMHLVTSFVLCLFMALPTTAAAEEFADESDFLAKVGSEWTRIADGVYEKQLADGQRLEHGFGRAGMEHLLRSTVERKAALLGAGSNGDLARYRQSLLELDRTIVALERALAESRDEPVRAAKSNCPAVSIGAQVSCSGTTGYGSSSVFFADFGPCNQAVGSVQAFGSPGTQDSWSGSVFCYQGKSASATCAVGQEGCFIYAFAEIDFTTCNDYQYRQASRFCGGPSLPR